RGRGAAIATAVAALLTLQLTAAARPYVETTGGAYLDAPSPLKDALDRHGGGRIKLLPPRHSVLNNWRQTYLASRGAPLFDPISVRALPPAEAAFFAAFGDRPLDLWRLGAVDTFFASRAAVEELIAQPGASDDFYVVETRRAGEWDPRLLDPGHRISRSLGARRDEAISLLELRTARPALRLLRTWTPVPDDDAGDRAALEAFADPEFDAPAARFVHGAPPPPAVRRGADQDGEVDILDRTPTRLEARVEGPGMLLRASRYDPRWRVRVDGEEVELLRANVLFQAVPIGPGEYRVVFEFAPSQGLFAFSVAARLGLLALAVAFFRRRGDA
ncbi:MAG: hypothetical protein AAGF23_22105, partial [Acidobacteriota bacterium]